MAARRACVMVLVTCPSRAVARRLAQRVVRRHLAACVNLVPSVESIFWWQGKLDRAREALLLIKTTVKAYPRLEAALRAQHPYDVPEIIAVPVTRGFAPYLRWVRQNVSGKDTGQKSP